MGNKSIQEENLGVLVKRVDCRIKELVEAADNYTREMNENYAYFFCWHAESGKFDVFGPREAVPADPLNLN